VTGAGQRQVPVQELIGQEPQRQQSWRYKLAKLLAWRDWKLPVKLAAVTLVPIVLAVALGGYVLTSKLESSAGYQRMDSLIGLSASVDRLLDAVQRERTETAVQLTKGGSSATPALRRARSAVNAQVEPLYEAVDRAVEQDPGVQPAATNTERLLGRLKSLRADVGQGKLDVVQSIDEYSAITRALLRLDGAATARVSDKAIGGTPQALRELAAAKEEIAVQQAIVAFGAARGSLAPSELSQVRTSEVRIEDRMANFFAVATAAERELLNSTVSEPSADTRARLARSVLGELGVASDEAIGKLSEREWQSSSGRVFDQLGIVVDKIAGDAKQTSNALVTESRANVLVLAVALGLALLLAIAVVFVITRHLLRSLKLLRNGAMHVAEKRLPEAVTAIQEGRGTDNPVEPVPVLTRDEVGEVARAFDAVHSQALKLATEQAGMHTAYSGVFVNLSRRSQSLVQRQLQLIERLERDEEDADQLAILFQLDHLATRMRRNNENLMMLSGSESARRSGRPVSTADVLRAAVSEIEQYQRVVVQSPPTTKVVGHAASDLMRLIAELLDNATSFSPPETQVTVASNVGADGSMVIDILDKGIGMNTAEVDEANSRMAEASSLAMVTSRRMGLFVVGRLASKHRIRVTLNGGKDIEGVRATVIVPEELVIGAGGGPLTSELPVISDSGPLPRREPGSTEGLPSPRTAESAEAAAAEQTTNGKKPAATEPAEQELPSGDALFKAGTSPLSDWWNAAAAASQQPSKAEAKPAEPAAKAERTPIFDEMLSVWFRTDAAAAKPTSDATAKADEKHEELSADKAWEFAADENLQAVKEMASKPEPSNLTEAGLPKRQRGERLLPGRATPEPLEPSRSSVGRADLPARDPQEIRSRLSGFQRGVQRGKHRARHRAELPPETAPDAAQAAAKNGKPDAGSANGKHTGGSLNGKHTESGLPKRQRGEQLLPGSAATTLTKAPQPERDPAAMRGRLNSFQQGVRRGRTNADPAPAASTTSEKDTKSPKMEGE
jgi:signal transduction histidine kinase